MIFYRQVWLILLLTLAVWFCESAFAEKELQPVSGTYKDALRKAGQAGKPLMLKFYRKGAVDCKRLETYFDEIPDTVKKFVMYELDADQNQALVKQFGVTRYPTPIFLKPDGMEITRVHGLSSSVAQERNYLERVLDQAGPIPISQKQREPPSDNTAKGAAERQAYETAAANELKAAMNRLNVGRKREAAKAFQQIVAKYPGSKAAEQAQEQLDELEPKEKER